MEYLALKALVRNNPKEGCFMLITLDLIGQMEWEM